MPARVRPTFDFLLCFFGPSLWAAYLFLVYVAETLICLLPASNARDLAFITLALTAAAASLVALATFAAWMTRWRRRQPPDDGSGGPFVVRIALLLAALSALAIVWLALPVAAVTPCVASAG